MIFIGEFSNPDKFREAIEKAYRADETACVDAMPNAAKMDLAKHKRVQSKARELVVEMRRRAQGVGGLDAFIHEYELSNQEGIILMCLAEALLRIPDAETATTG